MTLATTPVEALEKGLEIIEERGWTQGKFLNRETGSVCSLGAVYAATKGFNRKGDIRTRSPKGSGGVTRMAEAFLTAAILRRKAVDEYGEPVDNVVAYNDDIAENVGQIKRLFRSAISLAKKASQA